MDSVMFAAMFIAALLAAIILVMFDSRDCNREIEAAYRQGFTDGVAAERKGR